MIPNVTRGGRARGLLRYLTRPEQAVKPGEGQRVELHVNPRLVGGSERLMAEWAGYDLSPRYNPSAADQIAGLARSAAAAVGHPRHGAAPKRRRERPDPRGCRAAAG